VWRMERLGPEGGVYSRPQRFLDGGINRPATAEECHEFGMIMIRS